MMISKIELHLRSSAIGQHRCLGVIAIEHDRAHLAQNEDIAFCLAGRRVEACITSVRRHGAVPCVYADEVPAEELAS